MATRLTIYNRQGMYLAEFDAVCKRTWLLNKVGTAEFTISTQDSKCRGDFLQFGNLVLIEHDVLPAWGGVITTPRDWGKFAVKIHCKSADHLFYTRVGKAGMTFNSNSGANFNSLITFANTEEDLRIRAGDIDTGGAVIPVKLDPGNKLSVSLAELTKDSGYEYYLEPKLDANRQLYFSAHWYPRFGVEKLTRLEEGLNIEFVDELLTEQGDILNEYRVSEAGGKGEFTARDEESVGLYGLRQHSESMTINADKDGSLEAVAVNKLKAAKNPTQTFNFVVLNEGEIWSEMGLGNTFPVKMLTCGFTGNAIGMDTSIRVTGMTFDDEGRLEVVCEEVL